MSDNDLPLQGNEDAMVLEPGQDLVLQDENGLERLRLDASTGAVRFATEGGRVALFQGAGANLWLGGSGQDGDLLLFPGTAGGLEEDQATAHLSGDQASLRLGTAARPGRLAAQGDDQRVELDGGTGRVRATSQVDVRTAGGQLRVRLNADGTITVGGEGAGGRLNLRNSAGDTGIALNGSTAIVTLGGDGTAGQLLIRDAADELAIHLNGQTGAAALGASGNAGNLFVKDQQGENIIVMNGETGNMALGRDGNGGDLILKDDNGEDTVVLRGTTANLGLGRDGRAGNLFVKNDAGANVIHLSGQTGDIWLTTADCAEEFAVHGAPETLEAGTVMVIGDGERLQPSRGAYDRRVAGVLSGAGDCRPGILLGRQPEREDRRPLALVGKAYCKVDAGYGPVAIGDLLTTSDTPGHAMRASDPLRAFGSVIGKALQPLSSGQGLIPILIALQ